MSLLRSPGNSNVVTPQYTGIQMQASSSALPVPIMWGMTLVAPNVVWAGDFVAIPQYSQSGGKGGLLGGGSQLSGYDYQTAIVFGLCEGPISNVRYGYDGQDTYSLYQLGLGIKTGATPQAPWSYLTANHPKKAIGYPGTALLVSGAYDLGSSSSVGSISFEVLGTFAGTSVTNTDADPAMIINDFLTNAQYGVGFPAASINATTLFGGSGGSSYQAYCAAVGIGLSPALVDQEAANSILSRWLQLTNATAVWSGGQLKFVPFGDTTATGTLNSGTSITFVPNATPVYTLTDDDFIAGTDADPIVVTRSDPYAASNVVNLEVLSRAPTVASGSTITQQQTEPNYYAPTPIQARDQNAIELYGLRIGSTVTAHEICTTAIGQIVAQLILQRGLYIRNTYVFKLSWECCLLEPMDIVTLSDANLALAGTPVRILEIQEDSDGLLAVTAEEYPGAVGMTPGYAVDPATNDGFTSRSVVPDPVNAPVVFEPPSDLTGGVEQIRFGVSGGAGGVFDPNWGGAAVYASSDNATYAQIGSVSTPSRMGALTAALDAPPGIAGDLAQVSFAESGATVVGATMPTLVLIDHEILSFTTATLTGPNTYALGGLARTLYGQNGTAHAIGAPVLIFDPFVLTYALPQGLVGTPLWFKFASFNIFGAMQQDLSTCTAYPYTPVGSGVFGPVAQAIAAGTSFDEGLASTAATESDDDGLASDPYTRGLDMGLASDAAASLAVQLGGTGATSSAGARASLGAAASGANSDITGLSGLTTALTIAQGGTGATTAAGARTGLGTAASGANADIYQLSALTTALLVNQGGTGSTTASGARSNLGAAASGANSDITSLSGLTTALTIAQGGTGATTASGARTGLGAAASGANADVTSLTNLAGIGIGTAVDRTTNLFSMKSANALFDNAGAGVAIAVNKAASTGSAFHQFETGYSVRAQAGLLTSDRYRVSVSAAGASFTQALDIDPATGHVGLAGYTADANNALGVLGTSCLFSAVTDSMRFTFSKVASANDATLSFQTNFSARALLGTTGSDQFQLKVSPDGSTFYQVYVCDQTTGNAAFKALLSPASYTVASLPAGLNGALSPSPRTASMRWRSPGTAPASSSASPTANGGAYPTAPSSPPRRRAPMSVQVRRRREAAPFLATYVGAQGELLVDVTNNRVQVHDGATPGRLAGGAHQRSVRPQRDDQRQLHDQPARLCVGHRARRRRLRARPLEGRRRRMHLHVHPGGQRHDHHGKRGIAGAGGRGRRRLRDDIRAVVDRHGAGARLPGRAAQRRL